MVHRAARVWARRAALPGLPQGTVYFLSAERRQLRSSRGWKKVNCPRHALLRSGHCGKRRMAATPNQFNLVTRCHAPPAFSPLAAPGPCPVPVAWDGARAHRFGPGPERPARPCGDHLRRHTCLDAGRAHPFPPASCRDEVCGHRGRVWTKLGKTFLTDADRVGRADRHPALPLASERSRHGSLSLRTVV
jgi:hypothetical protein